MGRALQIQLKPRWEEIPGAWAPCEGHLTAAGLSRDEAYGLCMVTQELLENAVKYGRFDGEAPPVDLALEVTRDEVTIEVRSPVGEDDLHLREFDRAIQWIRGFQDPFEAYVERLKVVSAKAWEPGRSGLGLTRIAYEGRCVLDFYVDATSTLAVSAVWHR